VGLILRYIPTTTLVKQESHACILLRGKASPEVANTYVERPTFDPDRRMPFRVAMKQ
jgi:hypothetical protein